MENLKHTSYLARLVTILMLFISTCTPTSSSASASASPDQPNYTCYSTNGKTFPDLLSCNPNSSISHCCAHGDLCLSNGLCQNFGWDRYTQIHGCTDQNWKAPCLNQFRSSETTTERVILWMCGVPDNAHTAYCAGSVGCCENRGNWITLPNFYTIHSPLEPRIRLESNSPGSDRQDQDQEIALPLPESEITTGARLTSSDRIALGVGIPACFSVLIALLQWWYPPARIFQRNKRNKEDGDVYDLDLDQIHMNTSTDVQVVNGQRNLQGLQDSLFSDDHGLQSHAQRIGDLLESEDGWREIEPEVEHHPNFVV